MTVTFVKGLAGRLDKAAQRAVQNPQVQQASASIASQANSGSHRSEAAVNSVRFSRSEGKERLSPEKAEKLATSVADQVIADPQTAVAAFGELGSTSVRDFFTP